MADINKLKPARKQMITGVLQAFVCIVLPYTVALAQGARNGEHWVGTWAAAAMVRPQDPPPQPGEGAAHPPLNFKNQTLRQIVHISIGGERVRVVFSNVYGTAPLEIGAAHIALRD